MVPKSALALGLLAGQRVELRVLGALLRGGVVLRDLGDALVLGEDVAGGLALGLRHGVPPSCGSRSVVRRTGTGRRPASAALPAARAAMRRCAVPHVGRPGMRGATAGVARGAMAIADEVQRIGAPVRRWARTQKREYTNGEERPLAGDLGAMGVYVGLVSAAAAAVRASGRELPDRIPLGDAALLTVATFRLARRIAKDPVTSPLRAPFTRFQGPSGHAEVAEEVREHGGVKHAVGELLTCPFCLAQWVGTGVRVRLRHRAQATRLAALTMTMVAGSDVLQFVYDAIQNGGLAEPAEPRRRPPALGPGRAVLRPGDAARPPTCRGGPRATYPAILTRSGSSRGRGRARLGRGAACDRSGAGPCPSASSASA